MFIKCSKPVLITILCISLCWSINPANADQIDKVLAVVNDEIITSSELEERKRKLIEEMSRLVNPNELQERINLVESQTLDLMIEEILLIQKADELGLSVEQSAIDNALQNVLDQNKLSDLDALALALQQEGMSLEEYKKFIEKQLKIFRIQNYELKAKVRILEDEIKDFYTANSPKFETPKKYHLRHILFQVASALLSSAAQERAQLVYQKLQQGQDFCALAEEYSDDPTGSSCGDIGVVEQEVMLPEFQEALTTTSEGDYTKPLLTKFGYHILYLVKFEGGEPLPYDEVKEFIRERLYQERFFQKREEWMKELRKTNYVKIIEQQNDLQDTIE